MATDTRKEMMQDRARTSYKREKKNKKKKDNIPSNEYGCHGDLILKFSAILKFPSSETAL